MAEIAEMTKNNQDASERRWYYKETLSDAGAGKAVRIPGGDISAISFQITGDGYLEVTNYPKEDVESDSAEWIQLPSGADLNPSVGFVRQVNSSGTTVLNLGAQ